MGEVIREAQDPDFGLLRLERQLISGQAWVGTWPLQRGDKTTAVRLFFGEAEEGETALVMPADVRLALMEKLRDPAGLAALAAKEIMPTARIWAKHQERPAPTEAALAAALWPIEMGWYPAWDGFDIHLKEDLGVFTDHAVRLAFANDGALQEATL